MKTKLIILCISLLAAFGISFTVNPDAYVLDVGHTHIGFDVERFLVGEVSGRFNDFSGTVTMTGEDVTSLKVAVKINVNSLDTNNKTRDGHLKGVHWLDTGKYPEITFKSTGVEKRNDGNYIMKGNFTIHGVTNKVEFPVSVLGPFKDPTQETTIGIKADFVINRFDYGITFNKKMDNGSLFIGNEVKIKIRALAHKK